MNKKITLTLVSLFLFFYLFNYLTPMAFGDDYVYSFIWQGHSEFEPLTREAVRVSSLHDILSSQWSHYLTWSGRTISHTIAQFFLWMGKGVFNIFNAFVAVLLIVEIYWCAHKGEVSLQFKPGTFCWIFFALWAFSPGFSPVFFWLTGSCNYLWTSVLLLGFLLPYIRKHYFFEETVTNPFLYKYGMFLLGMIAGWTNENSICWIILVLFIFLIANRGKKGVEVWMITGLAGLMIGYALLMFAPGNVARLNAETGVTSGWFTMRLLIKNLPMLAVVFLFQFLLWYFNIRSLFVLKQIVLNKNLAKEVFLIKVLSIISFGMTIMMLFSPNFPPRSAFPGTVQLIIAVCVLLRVREEYSIELIQINARKLLFFTGIIYFLITTSSSLYGFYDYHIQMQELLTSVKNSTQTKEKIITVRPFKKVSGAVDYASGLHLIYYQMSEDVNDWRNVAFARYYGIKGIRMSKEEHKLNDKLHLSN